MKFRVTFIAYESVIVETDEDLDIDQLVDLAMEKIPNTRPDWEYDSDDQIEE